MKVPRPRLTYANVVSSLALFLVIAGGSAFAANQLAKNSVGTKQLKKNAVTAAKLKKNSVTTAKLNKNAVTGAKIKNGAVTGAKIDEASLGTVPSANTAASAGIADNLTGYSHKSIRLVATPVSGFNEGIEEAPETTILSAGPISITGKCFSYSNTVYAYFLIKSSTEGTAFDSDSDYSYGNNFLGPDTKPTDREVFYESASGDYSYYESEDGIFAATAADGTTVRGSVQVGVKSGTLTGGQGPYGSGDVCLLAGNMFTL